MVPDRLCHSPFECSSVRNRTFDLVSAASYKTEHRTVTSSVDLPFISLVYDRDWYGHVTRSTQPLFIRMQQYGAQDLRFSAAEH